MSETAPGRGTAHPVTAVTGPPLTPGEEAALAREDAAHADLAVEQVRAKLARAASEADAADARQALQDAQIAATAAHLKAERLTRETGG